MKKIKFELPEGWPNPGPDYLSPEGWELEKKLAYENLKQLLKK